MKKIFLFTAACFAALPLFAQQTQPLSLDEVVVTANKFQQKTSQTGKVVTVITQKDLQHQSGQDLAQILNRQAGMTVNGAGGTPGTNQNYYLRGADPKYTMIMIDGVPVNDVSNIGNFFDLNLIPVENIQRIEIMKGGYSAVYGSGAVAGVINIITKKGGTQPLQTHVLLSGGSYNTFKEQIGINGRKNRFDYNIQFQNEDSKGFSASRDTLGTQNFDKDGYHRKSVFAQFGYHPNASWSLNPFIRYSNQKGDLDQAAFVDDKNYTYGTDLFQTGLTVQHVFEKGDLNIKYSFNPTERKYDNLGIKDSYKSKTHYLDAYLHYNLNDRFSFLAGNTVKIENTDQKVNSFSSFLSADSAKTDAMSLYGSAFYHSPTGLNLELGGRLHQSEVYGFHPVFSINPSWYINNQVKAFINFSSSFVSPSLYQLYSAFGNPKLNPETGKSYETGVQTWLFNKKISVELAGFYRDMKNVIDFVGSHYVNYDKQNESGGEASLTYQINNQVKLSAYYAYVTGEVTVNNGAKDSSYNNLFKRPKSSAGATIGYQVTPELFVSLDGQYKGLRKEGVFNMVTYKTDVKDLDAYFLLNIYAQYTFRNRYRAFISLNNITDTKYTETIGFNTKGFNFQAGIALDLF